MASRGSRSAWPTTGARWRRGNTPEWSPRPPESALLLWWRSRTQEPPFPPRRKDCPPTSTHLNHREPRVCVRPPWPSTARFGEWPAWFPFRGFWVLAGACQRHGVGGFCCAIHHHYCTHHRATSTARPSTRAPRVLFGCPLPLGFGLDGRLLLARRGRVYV